MLDLGSRGRWFESSFGYYPILVYVDCSLAATSTFSEIYRKGAKYILQITKKEAFYLRSIGFKDKIDIHKSYPGHKKAKYYITEREKVMDALEKYRAR